MVSPWGMRGKGIGCQWPCEDEAPLAPPADQRKAGNQDGPCGTRPLDKVRKGHRLWPHASRQTDLARCSLWVRWQGRPCPCRAPEGPKRPQGARRACRAPSVPDGTGAPSTEDGTRQTHGVLGPKGRPRAGPLGVGSDHRIIQKFQAGISNEIRCLRTPFFGLLEPSEPLGPLG
jgi:hypothetical protein